MGTEVLGGKSEVVPLQRKQLLALGAIYLVLSAGLVVTWVASSMLFVLILALLLAAGAVAALVAGFRRPAEMTGAAVAGARPPAPAAARTPAPAAASIPAAAGAPAPIQPPPTPQQVRPFEVGARVRFAPEGLGTAHTQGHEVLLRDRTGTVTGFIGSDAVEVRWDAGPYEEYVDLVPTGSGMRATAGDTLTLDVFDTPVHQDNLRPADSDGETTGRPSRELADVAEPAPRGDNRRCSSCGREVLTTKAFVEMARRHGYVVDPLTGDASTGPGQALFDSLEETRGYTCRACGRAHCTGCLMRAPQHPVTHGPRCPSCAEGPHPPLED